jgi:hypothetical protein
VCSLEPHDFEGLDGDARVNAAVALGANEWHVHFSSSSGGLRGDLGRKQTTPSIAG